MVTTITRMVAILIAEVTEKMEDFLLLFGNFFWKLVNKVIKWEEEEIGKFDGKVVILFIFLFSLKKK